MPWVIREDVFSCDGLAIVNEETGALDGCYASEEAEARLTVLNATEDDMGDVNADPMKKRKRKGQAANTYSEPEFVEIPTVEFVSDPTYKPQE